MSRTLPFRLLGSEDLAALQLAIVAPVCAWENEWFSSPDKCVFHATTCFDGGAEEESGWMILGNPPEPWLGWRLPKDAIPEFAERLLGAPIPLGGVETPMIQSLIGECLFDLASRIFALAKMDFRPAERESVAGHSLPVDYGSGAACLRSSADLSPIVIFIGGEVVERIVARPSQKNMKALAMISRDTAIQRNRAQIEVLLGDAELTLADLANVVTGDVIRLQTRYSDPIVVRAPDGLAIIKAHLGSVGTRKAIQVIGKAS